MSVTAKDIYLSVFKNYPDVMDAKQVGEILGVSTKTVYILIRNNSLSALKVGREFRIPKVNVMRYMRVFDSKENIGKGVSK